MVTRMQQRRGTAAEWSSANPILAEGELGFERDTFVIKMGDGVTPWNSLGLPYLPTGGGTLTGNVIQNATPADDNHIARLVDITSAINSLAAAQLLQFPSSGTFDPTAYPNVRYLGIHCYGPGGGGGGAGSTDGDSGSGGGAGAYSFKLITMSSLGGTSRPVTVGLGGNGGINAAAGSAGSASTSFDSLVVAQPGLGGEHHGEGLQAEAGGLGGDDATGVGDIKLPGGDGGRAYNLASARIAGAGGASAGPFGGPQKPEIVLTAGGATDGSDGVGFGNGGSGAVNDGGGSRTGGKGANGRCLIFLFV